MTERLRPRAAATTCPSHPAGAAVIFFYSPARPRRKQPINNIKQNGFALREVAGFGTSHKAAL
jgi:hypothetical protein